MFFRHTTNADGTRLHEEASDSLWLVYSGKRHHVTCSGVFGNLFVPSVPLTPIKPADLEKVSRSDDLLFGTSLVRREGDHRVHLLAVHPRGVKLHPIPSKEVADKCGFDLALCRSLPGETFDRIRVGAGLS